MSFIKTNIKITKTICAVILMLQCLYCSYLVGTLTHELIHAEYATTPPLITINYDATGSTNTDHFIEHNHNLVYLQGNIVVVVLLVIDMFCLFMVMG